MPLKCIHIMDLMCVMLLLPLLILSQNIKASETGSRPHSTSLGWCHDPESTCTCTKQVGGKNDLVICC